MSKTMDELMRIYSDAACASSTFPQYETPDHRAAIAAVVRALRDEIDDRFKGEGCDRYDVQNLLNKILGAAGDEKVAGGSTSNDERQSEAAVSLYAATDRPPAPATDICEWEKLRNSFGFKVSCSTKWLMNENYGGDTCPLCEKRIEYKFTEESK